MTRRLFASVMVTVLLQGTVGAQSVDSLFMSAHEAYRSGEYTAAAERYESIIANGKVSAAIYFNLGNTYFRSGNIARTILSYERAFRLDPTDEDVRHNLELARLRTVDRIEPLPELFIITWTRWVRATLPTDIVIAGFLLGWCLIFVSLVIMFLVRSAFLVRITRATFFGGVFLTLVFGLLLLLQVLLIPTVNDGIIVTPTVTAKSSPDPASVDAFVVHEGLKVTLGDTVEEWVRITLSDGKTGWVQGSDLEPI